MTESPFLCDRKFLRTSLSHKKLSEGLHCGGRGTSRCRLQVTDTGGVLGGGELFLARFKKLYNSITVVGDYYETNGV